MAALHIIAVIFLTVNFFSGGFGVTDEEFKKVIGEMKEEIHEMSKMLKKQELGNVQKATIIRRLEEALMVSSDRNYKMEVLESDNFQNTTIEERVSLLELQVADLDQDVNFLFDQQVIQDERLLNLEETSDQVVVELVEVNADLQAEENIQNLQATDVDHDTRISTIEENGGNDELIAFHAVLTSYFTIAELTPVIFNQIVLNEGNGCNRFTGVFTVPPGGDGVYYFSVYLTVEPAEWARFDIRCNDDFICSTYPDHSNLESGCVPGSCSAVVNAVAGDEVKVLLEIADDNTPLIANTANFFSGFNGFRI